MQPEAGANARPRVAFPPPMSTFYPPFAPYLQSFQAMQQPLLYPPAYIQQQQMLLNQNPIQTAQFPPMVCPQMSFFPPPQMHNISNRGMKRRRLSTEDGNQKKDIASIMDEIEMLEKEGRRPASGDKAPQSIAQNPPLSNSVAPSFSTWINREVPRSDSVNSYASSSWASVAGYDANNHAAPMFQRSFATHSASKPAQSQGQRRKRQRQDDSFKHPTGPIASRFRGVSWHRRDNVWLARAWKDGKTRHLGCFRSEEVAALAVDLRHIANCGEHGRVLNFPDREQRKVLFEQLQSQDDRLKGYMEEAEARIRKDEEDDDHDNNSTAQQS